MDSVQTIESYVLLVVSSIQMETYLILVTFFLTTAAFISFWKHRSLDSRIPGPAGIPLLGNLLQVDLARPHLTLSNWSTTYGPIFRVNFGFGRNVVIVSEASSIREALVERGTELAGRPKTFRAGYTSNGYRNIGFGEPLVDDWWQPLRNSVRRELKATDGLGLRRLEAVTMEIACIMSDDITADGENGFKSIDLRPHLYSATLNIIATFLSGTRFQKSDIEFAQFSKMERLGVVFVSSSGGSGAELDIFPFLRFFKHPICKRLNEFAALRDDLFEKMKNLAERNSTKQSKAAGENPLIWTLINLANAHRQDQQSGLTDEHVKGTFTDLVLGGMSSTTNLVYALVNILLHNDQVYQRLKAELDKFQRQFDDVTELDTDRTRARYPSLADRPQLPYTQATILELLRYVCIAPFTVPHKALFDTSLCGYQLPQDTEVLPNLWHLHHDPSFWTEPWCFNPTRFLSADGLSVVSAEHPNRRHLMPFGAGVRRCTGEAFALSRLFLLVSHLLTDFNLVTSAESSEQLVSCDPRTYGLGIAIYPMDYSVRLSPSEAYRTLKAARDKVD